MAEIPTLYVCHGDEGGPRMHPCRRVQEALNAAGIEYEKVVAGHGSPIPFLRKGSREELRAATGETKLPVLKLPDGTVISHSRAILAWIREQGQPDEGGQDGEGGQAGDQVRTGDQGQDGEQRQAGHQGQAGAQEG